MSGNTPPELRPMESWHTMFGPGFRGLYSRENYEIPLRSGHAVSVRPRTYDAVVAKDIFADGCYEPSIDIPNPNTVVDLGANIGLFSVWAALRYAPNRIVAVEPDDRDYPLFHKNVGGLTCDGQVILLEGAVTADGRPVDLKRRRINTGHTQIREPSDGGTYASSVTLGSVAAVAGGRIDFLKVDIEGAEKELLTEDNQEIFGNHVGYVVLEVHRAAGFNPTYAADYFEECGLQTRIVPKSTLATLGYVQAVSA